MLVFDDFSFLGYIFFKWCFFKHVFLLPPKEIQVSRGRPFHVFSVAEVLRLRATLHRRRESSGIQSIRRIRLAKLKFFEDPREISPLGSPSSWCFNKKPSRLTLKKSTKILLMVQKSQTTTVWMVLKPYKSWDNHHPWWLAGFCPSTVAPVKWGFPERKLN